MDCNYDETSQEAVATIAMIKSMTTTPRRRSSVAKSPMLPRINNGKRATQPKDVFVRSNNVTGVDLSKSHGFNSWSARGVALASIEFKRRLEKRKSKPQTDFEIKADEAKPSSITEHPRMTGNDSQRIAVLKSIFDVRDHKTNNFRTLDGNLNPRKHPSLSRKNNYTKKTLSEAKNNPTTTNTSQLLLPLVSVMKITPQIRPSVSHRGTEANSLK